MKKYWALAIAIQLLWGLTPSASKHILEYLPVETYSAIRYSFSGLLFLIWALWKCRPLRIQFADLPKLMCLGILAYGIDSLGTLYGLRLGGVLNFALASSMNAIITASVALIFLKEKFSRRFLIAGSLSIAGGVLLALGKHESSGLKIAFASLTLIWMAYIFEALGLVYSKRLKSSYSLPVYLAILQLSAALFMWGLNWTTYGFANKFTILPLSAWAALAFVCIYSCGIAYFLLYWLLNHIEGHRLAFFDSFHTLSAVFFGVLFYAETLNLKMLLGGAFLLAAVFLITRGDQPRAKEA